MVFSMKKTLRIQCILHNKNKLATINEYDEIYSGWNDVLRSLSPNVNIVESNSEVHYGEIESYPTCNEGYDLLLIVDLSYPFLSPEAVIEALNKYNQSQSSYLITHNPAGQVISAIYITGLRDISEPKSHCCFPFILSNKESIKIENNMSLDVYYNNKNIKAYEYSSDKQLQDAIRYKDNLGDYYGKDVVGDHELERSARDAPERIEKLLSIETGEYCLDVGCSSGIITAKIAGLGKKIIGVEIVEELYDEAVLLKQSLTAETRSNISFINAPIEECVFDDEQFDTIYMTETLEHIPHFFYDSIFEKLLRYLKNDGNVLVSVPNRYPNIKYTLENRHRWDWYNHVTHFTLNSLSLYLSKYFEQLEFFSVYDEPLDEGVFIICKASNKR